MCHSNKISQTGRFIMGLLQLLWQKKGQVLQPYLSVCVAISLTACASTAPVQPIEQGINQLEKSPVEVAEVEPLPLNSELVYYVLTAELAGQRGEISVATELYNKAALTIDSPALASRSTQVANFTRDKTRINRALKRWLEVEPDNAEIYIMQTPFLIMSGDFDGLIQSTNKALNLAPEKNRLILAKIADNLSELAPSEDGLRVLKSIEAYKENNSDALFIYARLAAYYQQYELALPDIEKVLAQQIEREDVLILKAEILQRQGKGSEALAVLKKPGSRREASDDVLFAYAKLLGENSKTAEAKDIFEQLHAKLPKNEEVIFALGLLGLEEKDGEVAKSYFSQLILLDDPGKQAAYFMGLAEELEKNSEAALIWFASVPVESPRYKSAQGRYINLLADDGQLEQARLHLKLVRTENADQAEQYYIFEGAFLRERQQKQAAFELYSEALTLYPDNQKLLYGRAMVAEALSQLAIFEQDLKKILELEPNNATVLNALGYTLTDRTDRHEEALALIQRAMAISPNDPFYIDSLGWVYYRLGELDKARTYLKQAVAIQPDPEFLAHLGEVLWQQGMHDEAKRVWQQGLKKASDDKLLNDTMRRFGQ